jgi:hypothetical protein
LDHLFIGSQFHPITTVRRCEYVKLGLSGSKSVINLVNECIGVMFENQSDGAAPESAARNPGSQYSGATQTDVHQLVNFWT